MNQLQLGDVKAQAAAAQLAQWHRAIREQFKRSGFDIYRVKGAWRFGWVHMHGLPAITTTWSDADAGAQLELGGV